MTALVPSTLRRSFYLASAFAPLTRFWAQSAPTMSLFTSILALALSFLYSPPFGAAQGMFTLGGSICQRIADSWNSATRIRHRIGAIPAIRPSSGFGSSNYRHDTSVWWLLPHCRCCRTCLVLGSVFKHSCNRTCISGRWEWHQSHTNFSHSGRGGVHIQSVGDCVRWRFDTAKLSAHCQCWRSYPVCQAALSI